MTDQEFLELVDRYRREATTDPARYRRRVSFLVNVGRLYVFGIVAIVVLLAIIAAIAVITFHLGYLGMKVALALGALAFVILQSTQIKIPDPEGVVVEPADAPALFEMLGDLHRSVDAPTLEAVHVINDMNAAIASTGSTTNARHFLLLGLPLMQATTPEQFRAVLAHELGHLSRAHGTLGTQVYSARAMWMTLHRDLESQKQWGLMLFKSFAGWYAPYFNAATFVLAQQMEYEADRQSASSTSPHVAASMLTRIEIANGLWNEHYRTAMVAAAKRERLPVSGIFERLDQVIGAPLHPFDRIRWLEAARARMAAIGDTHPSYSERIAALGVPMPDDAPGPATPGESAAALLGPSRARVEAALERRWKGAVLQQWSEAHRQAAVSRQHLEAIEAKAADGPLSAAELFSRAMITCDLVGQSEGRAMLEASLASGTDHAPTLFWVGRMRLEDGAASGIALLERAMAQEPDSIVPSCQLALQFFESKGSSAEAKPFRERMEAHQRVLEQDALERGPFTPADRFDPHGLGDEQLASIKAQLEELPMIVASYLVRRRLSAVPSRPQFVLGVRLRKRMLARSERQDIGDVGRWFMNTDCLPAGSRLAILNREDPHHVAAIENVAGARLS